MFWEKNLRSIEQNSILNYKSRVGRMLAAVLLVTGFTQAGIARTTPEKLHQLMELCSDKAGVTEHKNVAIACLTGEIDQKSVESITKFGSRITHLVIDTKGGDVDYAMELGRRLFKDRSSLIVRRYCLSACANYIIPSASSVSIFPSSIVAMHGSAPRGIVEFTRFLRKSNPKLSAISASARSIKEFPGIRNGILRREQDFFDKILRDDAYLTRYSELVRDFSIRSGRGGNLSGMLLMLDKAYLDAFGISVRYWDDDRSKEMARYLATREFSGTPMIYGLFGMSLDAPP